jgi:hypothetical protein
MNWIQPIPGIREDGTLKKVAEITPTHVRRETDEEAAERRRHDAQEREQQRQKQAAAYGTPIPASPDKPAIVRAEDADDGHTHVDFRV